MGAVLAGTFVGVVFVGGFGASFWSISPIFLRPTLRDATSLLSVLFSSSNFAYFCLSALILSSQLGPSDFALVGLSAFALAVLSALAFVDVSVLAFVSAWT